MLPPDEWTDSLLLELTVDQLKEYCMFIGLLVGGTKEMLIRGLLLWREEHPRVDSDGRPIPGSFPGARVNCSQPVHAVSRVSVSTPIQTSLTQSLKALAALISLDTECAAQADRPVVAKPTRPIALRIERVFVEHMLLENVQITSDEGSSEIRDATFRVQVKGALRNRRNLRNPSSVVTLSTTPVCSCDDFDPSHLCKHIFFVYIRILRIRDDNPFIWQSKLLPDEWTQVAPLIVESVWDRLDPRYRLEHPRPISSKLNDLESGNKVPTLRQPVPGDVCSVCFEDLLTSSGTASHPIIFCEIECGCGNPFHVDCIDEWFSMNPRHTCPLCRIRWDRDEEDSEDERDDYQSDS